MKRKEYRGTRPHLACLKKARKSMKNRTIAGANSYRTATFHRWMLEYPPSLFFFFSYAMKKRSREVPPESLTGRKTGFFCCILHSRRIQLRSQSHLPVQHNHKKCRRVWNYVSRRERMNRKICSHLKPIKIQRSMHSFFVRSTKKRSTNEVQNKTSKVYVLSRRLSRLLTPAAVFQLMQRHKILLSVMPSP